MLRPRVTLAATAGRRPGLDLLRAAAILWVMDYHALSMGLIPSPNLVAGFGWMGVDLFFVLSGYLIGHQLFRPIAEGAPAAPFTFYARRLLRTLPAYLVVVALYFATPGFAEQAEIPPLWQFLTFTENLFVDFFHAKSFSHVWSLCVEEQFYLAAPVLVWALARRISASKVVLIGVALVLAGLLLRGWIWIHELAPLGDRAGPGNFVERWMERIYFPTWTRLDDLLAGLALALVRSFRPKLWRRLMARGDSLTAVGLLALAAAMAVCAVQRALVASVIGYPLLAAALACLVAAAASSTSVIGARAVPGASAVAAMAYSLYLTHKAVYHLVAAAAAGRLAPHPVLACVLYGGAALAAGGLLYLCVERPFLRLRDVWLRIPPTPVADTHVIETP